MLTALLLGQGVAFFISSGQRQQAIQQAVENDFVSRTSALASVLETLHPDMRRYVLLASSTAYARFWISAGSAEPDGHVWYRNGLAYLRLPLAEIITATPQEVAALLTSAESPATSVDDISTWANLNSGLWAASQPARFLRYADGDGMGIRLPLEDGAWLNAVSYKASQTEFFTPQSMLSLGISAIVLCIIGVFAARRIARPMRDLASSAEALGRGEMVAVSATGAPDDIQQLYTAFDRMQTRLRRFIDDRTRMVAAIGHDIRTPLTALRLRAEFVTDLPLQEKILASVDEMRAMTEAMLSFAKDEATAELTRTVDLAALLGSLCDDLADLGQDVRSADAERLNYRCRPDSLKRAVRNLVENAVRYAGSARVSIETTPSSIAIIVDDDGPGIDPDKFEQVFAPFYRLEESRNRGTGGVGLGLSIARAAARQHGGDIVLTCNHPGLRAKMVLPTG